MSEIKFYDNQGNEFKVVGKSIAVNSTGGLGRRMAMLKISGPEGEFEVSESVYAEKLEKGEYLKEKPKKAKEE